jgi:myo-inositol-1(or 4)-monophosphatase
MVSKTIFTSLITEIESAGQLARQYFINNESSNKQKEDGSVVTVIDNAIEDRLVTYIRTHFPDDSIVGEEGEEYVGSSDYVWQIDPIDGTDNFLRRIPFCAISVARLGSLDKGSFAIIHNPITQQTFSSFMHEGVYEKRIIHHINNEILGGRAIISITRGREVWMKTASYNLRKALGIRFGVGNSYGCCALEHAYVAANRLDGVLTFGLHTYDYAAGLYLIKSAGGTISVFNGETWCEWKRDIKSLCRDHGATIFSSHRGIHDEALALIGNPRKWSDEI